MWDGLKLRHYARELQRRRGGKLPLITSHEAVLAALARIATPEALTLLVEDAAFWFEKLDDRNSTGTRLAIVRALGSVARPPAAVVEAALLALWDPAHQVRTVATAALTSRMASRVPAAFAALAGKVEAAGRPGAAGFPRPKSVDRWEDSDRAAAAQLVAILEQIASPAAYQALAWMLGRRHAGAFHDASRVAAADALGRTGQAAAVPVLVAALDADPYWPVRRAAGRALRAMKWTADTPARRVLLAAAADLSAEVMAVGAATAGPLIASLVSYSREPDGRLVEILGDLGDARAVPTVLYWLRRAVEKGSLSGSEAVNALGKLGDRSAVPVLLALCSPGESGSRVEAVARALVGLGDPRAVGFLAGVFRDGRAGDALALVLQGLARILTREAARVSADALRAVVALPASRPQRYKVEGYWDNNQEWVSDHEATEWLGTAEVRDLARLELARRGLSSGLSDQLV